MTVEEIILKSIILKKTQKGKASGPAFLTTANLILSGHILTEKLCRSFNAILSEKNLLEMFEVKKKIYLFIKVKTMISVIPQTTVYYIDVCSEQTV